MYRVHNVCVLVSCCKGHLSPFLSSAAAAPGVCSRVVRGFVFAQLSTWPPLLIHVCVCARHCRVPEVKLRLRVGLVVQYFLGVLPCVFYFSLAPSPLFSLKSVEWLGDRTSVNYISADQNGADHSLPVDAREGDQAAVDYRERTTGEAEDLQQGQPQFRVAPVT